MNQTTQLFSILDWTAWSPSIVSKPDWLNWSEHPTLPSGDANIQAKSIPPLIRRRCSHLSKMAIEVSNQVQADYQIDYIVFCSQHGELLHTIELLKGIATDTELSPMRFSQSVHNTALGLFSLINQMHQNGISIAAGKRTFLMGMLEALVWLKLNPDQTVLLTVFNETTPVEYKTLNISDNSTYAVSMILKGGTNSSTDCSLTLDHDNQIHTESNMPQALEFLAWFLQVSNKQVLIQKALDQRFKWQKIDD